MKVKLTLLLATSTLLGFATPCLAADDGVGPKIFSEVCSECHTAKKQPLDKIRLTKGEWSEALERMVSYGAEIPKGKIPELLDYLVKTRGPSGATDEGKK
jgi:hypothetical protein